MCESGVFTAARARCADSVALKLRDLVYTHLIVHRAIPHCCVRLERVRSPTSFPSPTGQLAIARLVMLSCVSAYHLVGPSSGACCAPVLRTSFEPPGSTCTGSLLFSDSSPPRQGSQERCRILEKRTRVMPFIGTRCPSWSRRCAAGPPTPLPHAAIYCRPDSLPNRPCASSRRGCAMFASLSCRLGPFQNVHSQSCHLPRRCCRSRAAEMASRPTS